MTSDCANPNANLTLTTLIQYKDIHICIRIVLDFRVLLRPSCGQLYFAVTPTIKAPLILLRKFGNLTADFMAAEFTQTLFSIKLICFYSLNFSRLQVGTTANCVWQLMAFLHIPMRSSLTGRKALTNSGHSRTMRRSKPKASTV